MSGNNWLVKDQWPAILGITFLGRTTVAEKQKNPRKGGNKQTKTDTKISISESSLVHDPQAATPEARQEAEKKLKKVGEERRRNRKPDEPPVAEPTPHEEDGR